MLALLDSEPRCAGQIQHCAIAVPGGKEEIARYAALSKVAMRAPPENWERACAEHDALVLRVASRLAARARTHQGAFADLRMADDFVVFVRGHDVRRPADSARLTIDAGVYRRFFHQEPPWEGSTISRSSRGRKARARTPSRA